MGFVYRLTSPSNRSYIGQTIRPIAERFKEHQLPDSPCIAISRAIQKHGWHNMKKDWIEVPDDELNFYEEMLVALLGTITPCGYNLREGGGNGKWCEEVKQKMSDAHAGDKNPMFGRTGENHPSFGQTLSDEHKQSISKTMTGRTLTCDHKQNIGNAQKGDKNHMFGRTGENHPRSKKVYQYNLNGMFVQSFASSEDAARSLNKTRGSYISECANGKHESAYGFKWSFTEL
ncbi:GIY-YIG catalytic domain-containing endonuclease [Acanthocystis turfacea Chlorella virus NE-JV-2]|nr:GIY-YIG catalytic domain-containing endonuclease [Acanthocystis turfacea Chlorella virus NE-JV-2]